jgi:hypothetical protein
MSRIIFVYVNFIDFHKLRDSVPRKVLKYLTYKKHFVHKFYGHKQCIYISCFICLSIRNEC